ncbi:MAG: GNAT family N-acetyltransferase [Pseudobdellovibrionaceae bacterium]
MKNLNRTTKHLSIRPLKIEDFDSWKNAHLKMSSPKNSWDHGPKPASELTKINFKNIIKPQKERRTKDTFYDLGVFDKNGSLVGAVSVMEVVRGISHTAFLGYRIFNNYWRLGYGKEAVSAMLDIGFNEIKLHRIEAGIEPGNIRSIKLAKTLGMRREGLKKRAIFLRNHWVDLIMYTLTSEDMSIKFQASNLTIKPRS